MTLLQNSGQNGLTRQIQVTNRQSQAVLAGFELYYGNEAAACGASTVMTNNGNVLKQKILPLGVVQSFGYDSWNRLTHVDEKAGSVEQWRQDYVYDRWGNRAVNSTTSTAPVTNVTPQVADGSAAAMSGRYPGRNRSVMSGATVECGSGNSQYDCAGNMILYGADTASAQKLVYDGENRLVEVKDSNNTTVAKYFYDGQGRRVRRSSGGRETVYGYAVDGQLLAEWEVAAQPTTNMTCTTCYFGVDHLGSTRIVAASDGTVEKRTDYAPFGEEAPAGWSGRTEAMKYELGVAARWNPQRVRFTGKERDAETGLDYFGARYMSSAQGRFTSPDKPLLDQFENDPQSWNLYSYVRNNPLIFTDPTGRCKQGADGKYHDSDEGPCVAPGGTSVTVTEKAPKERDHAAEVQAEMTRMQYEAWKRNQERNKPKEDQPLTENAQKTLTVAYERTIHDLGCVALGYGIETASVVPSMEIVPKAFAPAGAKGGTSIASTLLRGGPRGLAIPTPVGTPGTATFAWRSSNTVGGVVGRWLPYVGLGVSAYRINQCLGQQP
ncbi:MAG: hypothetical protein A2107_00020 [Verrucomicrobia bacterium GWF2_62_7]|nr:MAG: hypothetical protein A2107_00020 [Verrucomicrobia bacterium GWF2_62_7]